jgi:NTP pyrophosphatase (non-canonical NTP hydrolase)
MCGEAGEAANAAKKLKRLETNMQTINEPGRHYETLQAAREAVAKEVADTIIYGLLLMARAGIADPEAVIREVYNKKSEEYGFPERV